MPVTDLPARERLQLAGATEILWAVFDPDWYLASYPDVANHLADHSPATVLAWYLQFGQPRGHSPNIFFDEAWHRHAYPGLADAIRAGHVASAFDAYCRGGFRSRSAHWLFEESSYRRRYPDISDAALDTADIANGYDHYLRHGNREARIGHPLFDPTFYQAALEPDDVTRAQALGPFPHYLRRVASVAPEPQTSGYFDPAWYLSRYRMVAGAVEAGTWRCALHHYLCNDTPTAFDPLPEFSEAFYLKRNPDLAAVVQGGEIRNGYAHFLRHGVVELRPPNEAIDLRYYVTQDPVRVDLEQGRAPDAFWHWLRIGRPGGLRVVPPPEEIITEGQGRTLARRRAQVLLPLIARAPLQFACSGQPAISVVMVLYDQFALTLLALSALGDTFCGDIELILIDSGSTDETRNIGRYVQGARVLPFDVDLGLLRGRNAALHAVTADAVLFLRADVELAPGALAAALQRLQADPGIGAVGGKVIRSHGVLAEAGGIVWRDGSVQPYQRDVAPTRPEANFRRVVDVCSSACLLVRTAPLRDLEGYDDSFGPGPFADADLCLRLAAAGYRTEYDPALTLYCHGDLAPPPAAEARAGEQAALRERHTAFLETRPAPDPRVQVFARDRDEASRVLFIEDTLPLRRIGSGFVRSNDLVRAMAALGHRVTVYPVNGSRFDLANVYADTPDSVEVMHDWSIDQLGDFLRQRQGYYDTIWIARAHNLDRVQPILSRALSPEAPAPRLVLDTEAIAALREAMHATLVGEVQGDVDAAIRQEFANAQHCQHVVAVNKAEAQILRRLVTPDVSVIGHVSRPNPKPRPFERRAGMLFVGAIHKLDSPNYDSLCWFVDAVLPLIERELRWETRLTVVGYLAPGVTLDRFREHPRVTLRGPVADTEPLYDSHRLFVAPTRFAAGMPYKLHEAASFGLPIVATDLLCDQLGWTSGETLLAASPNDPAVFAQHVVTLYRDPALWQRLREAALARLTAENRPEAYAAALERVLGPAKRDR